MLQPLRKQNYAAFWIAGVVFVVFLAIALFHLTMLHRYNAGESLRYLNDSVSQRRAALNQQLKGDIQALRGVAVSLSELDINSKEKVFNILSIVNDGNSFLRMGFVDRNGIATMINNDDSVFRDVDFSSKSFFKKAIKGEEALSPTFFDDLSNEYANYYAVPIRKYGEVVGVLVAANDDDTMRNIISVSVLNGEGHYFVINRAGITVVPTIPDIMHGLGSDVFQVVDFTEAEREKFKEMLAKDTDGDFNFSYMGKEQFGVLQPLGVNDWFIMGVVPRSVVHSHHNRVSVGTALTIMLAALIFMFHIYWLFNVATKNQKELEHLAYTDPLTGERNYLKFLIDAELILGENDGKSYAIWSFDVKQFGRVNELYGSDAGNEVLVKVAELLGEQAGDGIMCRNSADQFTGLMSYDKREDMCCWAERIFTELAESEAIHKSRTRLDGAIGIYCIDDFEEKLAVDKMVSRAIEAKKQTKLTAGSSALFFTDDMSRIIHREVQLEADSKAALFAGDITFHLQPKVFIQGDCRIAGAEALARWNNPTYGRIPPDSFIPLFERNGFIVTLDREIFDQVCRWYSSWLRGGNDPVVVSINVSRQGLLHDDFMAYYIMVKEKHGIPDGHLELEFTESVVLNDYRQFCRTVEELQRAGFKCSIDDFGSGYSSLNVLKNLPIDTLKLDALFFRGEDSLGRAHSVVENFISLAQKLHIKTVAEGVEEKTQVEFLRNAGCDQIQGYFFSPPIPPDEFKQLNLEIGYDMIVRKRS